MEILSQLWDKEILLYIAIGFFAQVIDGALGMAYGVTSNTLVLSLIPGIKASQSSALVHCAEFFTTFISGISHFKFGNVDKKLFKNLVIPGVIGGVIGAYVLTSIPDKIIKPIVLAYLIIIGITIFYKALRVTEHKEVTKHIIHIGVVGGFFDATGGGGWGPIVTSTLIARGHNPKLVIGSVNASEWFVTMAEAAAFVMSLGSGFLTTYWKAILGLLVGGAITAPFAAYVTKKVKVKPLMILVALLILVVNVFKLLQFFKIIPSILK